MNLLAERYGWTYSSDELRTYIRRSGAYQKAGVKKVFTNDVMGIKEENERLKEDMNKMQEEIKSMKSILDLHEGKWFSQFKKEIEENPDKWG